MPPAGSIPGRAATCTMKPEPCCCMCGATARLSHSAGPRLTAHGFLIFALDRPDVLLSGDLALRHAVPRLYWLGHLPTEREMIEVAERWRPCRSLAVSYLFASEFEEGT
jgi:hypothetical protein